MPENGEEFDLRDEELVGDVIVALTLDRIDEHSRYDKESMAGAVALSAAYVDGRISLPPDTDVNSPEFMAKGKRLTELVLKQYNQPKGKEEK